MSPELVKPVQFLMVPNPAPEQGKPIQNCSVPTAVPELTIFLL